MNGTHDLGGQHGFGPVVAEPQESEPYFHAAWERDVFSTMIALGRVGRWSLDEFRRNIEHLDPVDYLTFSYYEKWLASLERLAVDHLLVTPEELVTGHSSTAPVPDPPRPFVANFDPPETPLAYAPGDRVRAANRHPAAHTREPRYLRGRVGTVVGVVGAEPFPEEASVGICRTEHVYLVRFEAAELWGPDGGRNDAVYVELWDSYLEPVS